MADARIFADLKKDHDNHRALLARIDETKDKGALEKLFIEFRTEVTAHAAAEEESLYSTMLAKPDLREEAQHSVSEHKEIEDYMEEMADHDAGSVKWNAIYAQLRKRYLHHIEEEEEEMFPEASDGLSDAEEKRLATVFEARKPAELKRAEKAIAEEEKA
ncbi:hemerythrin domain-containing protein [Sphingobium sufflavum]|jgi:hemerythrin superfamily protein|uniref:hemerythrin domain-containing protein n=1 Tax=Sphingobium sufflavum TaxID=1129547 RepID=UPI001F365D1E|nr:hemerythrin domain-containing protein [Sphingobium sufflavum]MCE7794985.1 hemerythrin domain-containing protein [Sphingobium sufflavum]